MKQSVKKFNNFIKRTIFIVQNKTNNKLQIVKKFNNFINKAILKVQNKTNSKLQISEFNKYLIVFISLLFFYLFYLSIPILYGKNWVQKNIEDKLLKDFKIHFSLSSDISYRILPSPHYLIKDSKILKEVDKTVSLAEIKTLRVFVSQKNFFNKKNLMLRHIEIDSANFLLLSGDLMSLKNSASNKLSYKEIKIKKSNIFFKDKLGEKISVIKVSDLLFLQDEESSQNFFKLKGNVFNTPFSLFYKKKFDSSKAEETTLTSKTLKLNMLNIHINKKDDNGGKNIISFLNSKINTNYKIEDSIIKFDTTNSTINNSNIDYKGKLSINPFELDLNINVDNYDLRKIFDNNSILNELIRTELLFNDNISMKASITTTLNSINSLYQNAKINFNIIDGKLNIDKTRLINKKIGSIELDNSNLAFESDRLILNTDIVVSIDNYEELFSLLQTNKKFRKPIKNVLINLDYDFLSNEINFNNIKIDNQEINDELSRTIEGFSDSNLNNWNKSRRLLNSLFKAYEG